MNTQLIQSGGVQTTVILPQIIYLDFDGELTRYNGELLTIDDVTVEDSGLTEERIAQITQALNDRFAGQNVLFVSERSDLSDQSDYSTIFVGKTSSFAPYGSFAGLAETVDSGNKIKNDNAFVMLDSLSSNERIADVIAHEVGHLLGTLDHGGEGLQKYGYNQRYDVSSGVTSTGIVLSTWDSMYVSSGGVANSTTVNSGGQMYVSNGGTANSTTVNSWGELRVESGGTANSTTINGGWMWVSNGGGLHVESGGTATAMTAFSGARLYLTVAPETYIQGTSNGSAFEMKNAYISGYTVNSWGYLYVTSGGTANSTTVNSEGTMIVYYGGIVNSTTVNSSGELYVYHRGTANSTTVNDGGRMYVSSGGTALAIKENGGYVCFPDGADVTFTPNTIEGLVLEEYHNATLHSGTTANSSTINAGGHLYVSNGGTANSTTVNSSGVLYVDGGGTALAIKENGGYVVLDSDANVTFVANSFSGLVLSSCATLHSGTTANRVTICYGGDLYVSSGGIANGTNIRYGGDLYVSSGGTANEAFNSSGCLYALNGGVANSTTVTSGGNLYVSSGGIANGTNIHAGGSQHVAGGGTAKSTTISDFGRLSVSSGGAISNTTVNCNGGLFVYSGGTISGKLNITPNCYVSADQGAIINFTVAEQESPDTALINNWSWISGGADADYTITVKNGQTNGTYRLADGAADFANTITVKNTTGDQLGTLAVGETKTFRDVNYTLSKNADALSLSVSGAVVAVAVKSDVDGNGVSDVMFQYTGGDYQIGFWMNGTNTWQGQGVSQPSNWELLGAYDMDQNGKADLVMRGNIQIGENKGAYIGYYKDGDVTQWQNINFLNNPTDVDWKLAIGNVTGNDNCNSLVWHAPELGALGVWTDGTANWVSLGSGYDSNWTMLGCGDFDGNGKDEVLFTNDGNLYTTDIDQNFASLGGWGTDWEVKTIGDFAGDGQDDIILQNGNMIVKFNNGKADEWESIGAMDASDWFIVGAGDYNGDQQDDLLVRQYSTGMLGYYSAGDMSQWNELGRGVDMNWNVIA